MARSRMRTLALVTALLWGSFHSLCYASKDVSAASKAEKLGIQAVIYGLPLVITELTREVATNVLSPQANGHAPVNQLSSILSYPTEADKDIVRLNVDTLYTFGFLDLSKEPMVLSLPDTQGRYFLVPLIDAWTNIFASPGKRTTGTKAANFLITGPQWKGKVPQGMLAYHSPTNCVMVAGRIQAKGPKDYKAVNTLQKQFRLTPLSAWGKDYRPPLGKIHPQWSKRPPSEQVEAMSSLQFFKLLAHFLKENPPAAADAPLMKQFAAIGLVPGQEFEPSKLDPAIAKALENALKEALAKLQELAKHNGDTINGWNRLPEDVGNFGTDYETRAAVALVGFGANLPQDASYQMSYFDKDEHPLDGNYAYHLHYNKGATPPAKAFWSITLYNAKSFLVANSIKRYNIASWMPLQFNPDGSLDIYIQHPSPSKDKESNWLPAPQGEFNLTLRVYWPKETMLDGTWTPAPILKN